MGPATAPFHVVIQSLPPQRTPILQALVSLPTFCFSDGHKMMKSLLLDDSADTDIDWDYIEHGYSAPRTPSTVSDHPGGESDEGPGRYDSDEDEEYGGSTQVSKRKKGGYDSRIEQILYENPDLPILIVDAGKSSESGGKYIVYTIKTGVRYASFILELALTVTGS